MQVSMSANQTKNLFSVHPFAYLRKRISLTNSFFSLRVSLCALPEFCWIYYPSPWTSSSCFPLGRDPETSAMSLVNVLLELSGLPDPLYPVALWWLLELSTVEPMVRESLVPLALARWYNGMTRLTAHCVPLYSCNQHEGEDQWPWL
jgi:hypothetical protein